MHPHLLHLGWACFVIQTWFQLKMLKSVKREVIHCNYEVRVKMWRLSSSTPVCTEANTSTVTPAHLMMHMIRYFFPLCIGMLGLNPCKALVTFALQHPPLHSSGQNWAMVRIFSIQIESLSICQTKDCPLATT